MFTIGCEPEPKPTSQSPQQTAEKLEEQQTAQAEQEMMLVEPMPTDANLPVSPEPEPLPTTAAEPQAKPAAEPVSQTADVNEPKLVEPNEQIPAQDTAATVNGEPITAERLNNLVESNMQRMQQRMQGRNAPPGFLEQKRKQVAEQILEGLILEALVEQELKKNAITVTDEQIDNYVEQIAAREGMTVDQLKTLITAGGSTFEQWKQQMQFEKIIGILALARQQGFISNDVNDSAARNFYDANIENYQVPEQVEVSHILIVPEADADTDPNVADTKALAKAQYLLEQIKNGADFAQLATENSACPSAARGGDLGFGERGTWVPQFSDAAFALEPNQVSDVVKTRFGYHIIKVTDRKPAQTIPFEEVKDEISAALESEKEMQAIGAFVQSLKQNADIVYAPGYGPQADDQDTTQLPQ
jgi:peptidyl-prolyl cis-trans isomerase C